MSRTEYDELIMSSSVLTESAPNMDPSPFSCAAEPLYSSVAASEKVLGSSSLVGSPARINTTAQSPPLLVQLLVESPDGQHLTLPVHTTDTIRELKMALGNKSWFTSKHCLFFGNRQLLDHHQVADIVCQAKGNDSYLHVFVRASDVRFGQLSTSSTSVSFGNLKHLEEGGTPPSALNETRSLSRSASADDTALQAVEEAMSEQVAAETVLHIVIRKTSHVSWNTARSGEFELSVRATDTAGHLKEQLKQQQLIPAADGKNGLLEDIDFYHCGVRLLADRPLLQYGLQHGDVLDIVPWEPTVSVSATPRDSSAGGALIPLLSSPSHELNLCWQRAADGLRAGIAPELAPSGTGGSYFLYDTDRNVVAVFKPVDEEPNTRNNPRGHALSPQPFLSPGSIPPKDLYVRRGILPGQGAYREIAAYLLGGSWSGVPATAPVRLAYPDGSAKHGSLQQFIKSDCDCEEMGYSAFSVAEVHKIAVLDLRLANADRNGSNILARKEPDGSWLLIPIDHGYCLPGQWTDISLGWSSWRQAAVPFDDAMGEYIMQNDPDRDLGMLRESGIYISPESARIFKAADMLLKQIARRGLAPKDAADILERHTLRKSTMEKLHRVACERAAREGGEKDCPTVNNPVPSTPAALPGTDEAYLKHLQTLVDEYLAELHQTVEL